MRDKASFSAAEHLTNDEKLLTAHIEDMIRAADKSFSPGFTGFLSGGEAALAGRFLEYMGESRFIFWGGFEGAERVILGIFPDDYSDMSERLASFPLRIVKFTGRMTGELSHRDYLGAIMSLGIERSLTGDIVCGEGCAYAVLSPAAAELALSVSKIGRAGVKCTLASPEDRVARNDSFREISGTVPSLRLDCIVSEAAGISRSKAAALISSGAVSVDHKVTQSVSGNVEQGAVLSIRGVGRFILSEVCGRTKKDRIHIIIKKYL